MKYDLRREIRYLLPQVFNLADVTNAMVYIAVTYGLVRSDAEMDDRQLRQVHAVP